MLMGISEWAHTHDKFGGGGQILLVLYQLPSCVNARASKSALERAPHMHICSVSRPGRKSRPNLPMGSTLKPRFTNQAHAHTINGGRAEFACLLSVTPL